MINGNEQWIALIRLFCNLLEFLCKLKNLLSIVDITRKQDYIPNMITLNQIDNFQGRSCSPEANHQQLANLLFQCHVMSVIIQGYT